MEGESINKMMQPNNNVAKKIREIMQSFFKKNILITVMCISVYAIYI